MRKFLFEVLSEADIEVIGDTPKRSTRGQEILDWLLEHSSVKRYVALEDNDTHINSFKQLDIPYVRTHMRDNSSLLLDE